MYEARAPNGVRETGIRRGRGKPGVCLSGHAYCLSESGRAPLKSASSCITTGRIQCGLIDRPSRCHRARGFCLKAKVGIREQVDLIPENL